jgi:AraC-like DNA-binding protein
MPSIDAPKTSRTLLPAHEPRSTIVPEVEFRKRPGSSIGKHRVTVSRWTSPIGKYPLELRADPSALDDAHVLTYALQPSDAELTFLGKEFLNREVGSNDLLLTGPYQPIRSIQRQPFDGIRIYLPQTLFAECFETAYDRVPSNEIVVSDPKIMADPMLETMMKMIFLCNNYGDQFVPSFIEGIGTAIAARLLQLDSNRTGIPKRSKEALATRRLKRVLEYIDNNIGRPIYLEELGGVAGLSRMRFAAQFRASTGHSPHEYILRRKVAKAQQLLVDPHVRISDTAMLLGFHSQGHLTTVFKKIVGTSPGRWRRDVVGRTPQETA